MRSSSMTEMRRIGPRHCGQVRTSIAKTRLSNCAHCGELRRLRDAIQARLGDTGVGRGRDAISSSSRRLEEDLDRLAECLEDLRRLLGNARYFPQPSIFTLVERSGSRFHLVFDSPPSAGALVKVFGAWL
jgi:hypothetical protein